MSNNYVNLPVEGNAKIYPNASFFPAAPEQGTLVVAEDTGIVYEYYNGAYIVISSPVAGVGTVTSVGLSLPSIFTVTGSPVTTAGTLTGSFNTQPTNTVFAGPTSGADDIPAFRALVVADIPSLTSIYVPLTRTISTTAPLTGGGALSSNLTLAIPASTNSVDGYLTAADHTSFAAKQSAGNYITALTGDATASGPGSVALTFATVNSNVGSFGGATAVSTFTVNAKGLITAAGSTSIQIVESQVTNLVSDLAAKQPTGNYITALTGDVTATGPNSVPATLATVNSNVGSFGTASSVSTVTVNGKGLVTAASNTSIQIAESQVTNLVSDLAGTLKVANNLSDVASAKTSRVNLDIDQLHTVADANYTILSTDRTVEMTSITASRTLTLPAANSVNAGQTLVVGDTSGSLVPGSITITIAAAGGDTVNGAASFVIGYPRGNATLISNGSNLWSYDVVGPGRGGTGATTITAARANLGIETGFSLLTSGTTFTTPSTITTATRFKFTLIGGGGSGGGRSGAANGKSGGGSGAGTAIVILTGLTPSTAYTYAIGAGAAGVSGSAGTAGGDTTLTIAATTYTAGGGLGGTSTGGANTTAGGTTTNATIGIPGQGVYGLSGSLSTNTSTAGGNTLYGFGGPAVGSPATGETTGPAGVGYGSGGAGGACGLASPTNSTGGAGANGVIIVEYVN